MYTKVELIAISCELQRTVWLFIWIPKQLRVPRLFAVDHYEKENHGTDLAWYGPNDRFLLMSIRRAQLAWIYRATISRTAWSVEIANAIVEDAGLV